MIFADIPAGDRIFLDANPLIYYFAADPVFGPACSQLVTCIENQEIMALTSTHVLSEAAHHLMTLESGRPFRLAVEGRSAAQTTTCQHSKTEEFSPGYR